jgi:hypothetical protein
VKIAVIGNGYVGLVSGVSVETAELDSWVGLEPHTAVNAGVARFVECYRRYYDH